MVGLANNFYPKETGGALMGFYSNKDVVVVTDLIDSGPDAVHSVNSFTPDYEFQEKQIATLYAESNRLHTYLGDWHSHPNGSASLSYKDQDTLRRIGTFLKARAPLPIMLLLAGKKDSWELKSWQLKAQKIFGLFVKSKIDTVELNIVVFKKS